MLTYSQVIDFALGRPTVVIFTRWKYCHTSCRGNVVNDVVIVSVLPTDPLLSPRICFCNFKVAHIISIINPLALELDIYSLAHHLCKM